MTEYERLDVIRAHLEEALEYLSACALPDAVDHIGAALAEVQVEMGVDDDEDE